MSTRQECAGARPPAGRVKLTTLRPEQAAYTGAQVEGPYSRTTNRY